MTASVAAGVQIHWEGEEGEPLLLVAGPPTSSVVFRAIQARLLPLRTGAVDLVAGPRVDRIEELADRLAAACVETGARALVAHGLALPLAWQLPPMAVPHLIVSNGPLTRMHVVPRGLARFPGPVWEGLMLRPGFAERWLSSSLVLRRTVANPYVMEKETVSRLLSELIVDTDARANTALWVRELHRLLPLTRERGGRVDAVWGDRDSLHPIGQIEGFFQGHPKWRLERIPGGRWLHPEERPWALADGLAGLLTAQTTT